MTPAHKALAGVTALALVALCACAFFLNHDYRALRGARADAEAARLALAHQVVATEDTRKQLQASVDDLLAQNAGLRAAVESAKAAAPGAVPVSAARLDTGPLVVHVEPAGAEAMNPAPHTEAQPPAPHPADLSSAPALPACALREADHASIVVDQVTLQTREGNLLIAGTATAYTEPEHRLLLGGRFVSALSTTEALAPPTEPRWGAALLGSCGLAGCSLGAGVLFPPLRAFGVRLEGVLGLDTGLDGTHLQGSLGIRF